MFGCWRAVPALPQPPVLPETDESGSDDDSGAGYFHAIEPPPPPTLLRCTGAADVARCRPELPAVATRCTFGTLSDKVKAFDISVGRLSYLKVAHAAHIVSVCNLHPWQVEKKGSARFVCEHYGSAKKKTEAAAAIQARRADDVAQGMAQSVMTRNTTGQKASKCTAVVRFKFVNFQVCFSCAA